MAFTDEDYFRLSERVNNECFCRGEDHRSDCPWLLLRLMRSRLEAAERVIEPALERRFQYDDGLVMYDYNFTTSEVARLMDDWRKSAGKGD